ncbi:unnamed protein product [Durusdinium trenchii]|uniref:Uncharacterized protein n=1 Tax=Durusdinium trenchii TaxID=1381693 RepID=A0ABP0K0K9_9DINO
MVLAERVYEECVDTKPCRKRSISSNCSDRSGLSSAESSQIEKHPGAIGETCRQRSCPIRKSLQGMGTEQPTCLLADCPEFIEPAICFRNFTHLGRYETDVKPEEPGHEAPAETGSGVSVPSLFGIPSFDKKQDTNGKGQDESDEEEQRPEPEPPQKAEGECKTQ